MVITGLDMWNNGEDSLAHYKYIKKIKIGPFTRYFYSMKDLQNYYNSIRLKYNKDDIDDYSSDEDFRKRHTHQTGLFTQNDPVHDLRLYNSINNNNKKLAFRDTMNFALGNLTGFNNYSSAKTEYKERSKEAKDSHGSYGWNPDEHEEQYMNSRLDKIPKKKKKKLHSEFDKLYFDKTGPLGIKYRTY